jgi:SAM-dependent methyltransferase
MSNVWDKVYGADHSFFGEEPSNFALLCYERMKMHNVKKILELGCGQGRDCVFFTSKGINVKTLDYSKVAIDTLYEYAKAKKLSIDAIVHDAKKGLPYKDGEFDAVYSHMFFSMHFTKEELQFMFNEVRRVLGSNGLNFLSVRSEKDRFYAKGRQVAAGIYDINGFEIRFFTRKEITDLMQGFIIDEIAEAIEEPASLYFVFSRKI